MITVQLLLIAFFWIAKCECVEWHNILSDNKALFLLKKLRSIDTRKNTSNKEINFLAYWLVLKFYKNVKIAINRSLLELKNINM